MDSFPLPTLGEIEAASTVVYQAMPPTPQYRWPLLEAEFACGTQIWVKHENHTPVGAFKVRGGLVYFDQLRREHPYIRGVVTATRGNHGQSVGFAARQHGLAATVVVPHGNSVEKNAAMRAFGVELIEAGEDFQAAREVAAELAQTQNLHLIPAFHPALVRGVATYSWEMHRAIPDLQTVYVPIGMGSGICGMAAARNALGHGVEIVGVASAHAPAIALSFATGAVVEHPSTTMLADGVATRRPDPQALAIIRAHVARIVTVDDAAVAQAMRLLFSATHNVAEGAGAIGLAAAHQERERVAGQRVGVILCGGNVDSEQFAAVLNREN